MLLDSGLKFEDRRVSDRNKEINGKKKSQKEERTYRSSVGREWIAHDIRITGHDALSSKAIQAISIDYLKDVWKINGLTSSRSPSYNSSHQ